MRAGHAVRPVDEGHSRTGGDEPEEQREERYVGQGWRFPPFAAALLSGILLALGFGLSRISGISEGVSVGLYVAAALAGGFHWGREAAESLLRLRIDIDVLMGVATVGAGILGLWEEAAFLAFLYGAAESLEEYTYDRTRGAIRALLDLAPKEARLLRDGHETVVPAAELRPGDRFLVRPGESLPTDWPRRRRQSTTCGYLNRPVLDATNRSFGKLVDLIARLDSRYRPSSGCGFAPKARAHRRGTPRSACPERPRQADRGPRWAPADPRPGHRAVPRVRPPQAARRRRLGLRAASATEVEPAGRPCRRTVPASLRCLGRRRPRVVARLD